MKLFKCTNCGQLVYFENTRCEKCGDALGFEPEALQMMSLKPAKDGYFKVHGRKSKQLYRYCSNYMHQVCNWLVPVEAPSEFCRACELNRTIPNLDKPEYVERWRVIEKSKHRLIYSLLRMQLPVVSKTVDEEKGLWFDFVADEDTEGEERVLTGHDNGLITINIAEADDIEREMARKSMHEVYRTVLGHFRHEIGHYYWDRLIKDANRFDEYRALFGDEQNDYAAALKQHYEQGAPPDWNFHFISSYASTHPWEDWAETWAHYMHIVDTLETAYAFGLSVDPRGAQTSSKLRAEIKSDPYQVQDFDTIIQLWLPLTFTVNSLNRSMGLPDIYPFVINEEVMAKLRFIHALLLESPGHNSLQVHVPQESIVGSSA